MDQELKDDDLQDLYGWIDTIPLSRPKRNIRRDFSDGVLAAEVVKYFFPKMVDLHNYISSHSKQQKLDNWILLNRKVFSKLNFNVPMETIKMIIVSSAGVIEPVLFILRENIEKRLQHIKENIVDVRHFDTKLYEKLNAEFSQTEVAHLGREEPTKDEKSAIIKGKALYKAQFNTDIDPAFKILLQEKDQALMRMQEELEKLKLKMSRLNHLLYLKDIHIAELTQYLETYRAKGSQR